MLRLLEPPRANRDALWQQLFDGTYDKPFILDTGRLRCLHFDFDAVQSAMLLSDPNRLSLAYTRKMMSFLLFKEAPKRILMLGLGGGSLAKFCYRHLPNAFITAVEVNPDVIALRDDFLIPADNDRFRVICADSASYISHRGGRGKDVILADACDRAGVAPGLEAIEFYQNAWHSLSHDGVFVMNLCGDPAYFTGHLAKIRQVFGEFMTLPVRRSNNLIVLALKQDDAGFTWEQLEARSRDLKRRFQLEFPRYVRGMAVEWQLRKLRLFAQAPLYPHES